MFALSIQQPWAWLIVNGYKDIENRTWGSSRRGPIWIHAGKRFDGEGHQSILRNLLALSEGTDLMDRLPHYQSQFPMGGIVGMATIIDCVDYHPGRWFVGPNGFVLKDQLPLEFRPYKGQLGFFEVK